ncbi:hypothetical protein JCM8097_005818 [Rhodosporidiobolus ruineniae]
MKPSSTVAQAVKATKTPRRRLRASSLSHDSSAAIPPSRDLIGPPCPLSNLRPVYYAPLFPALHAAASSTPTNPHPYSLAEFPTTSALSSSPSSSRASAKQQRLQRLQRTLHARDLEWRLTRYRLDAFNQDFWARMNTQFLRARDGYIARQEAEAAALHGVDGAAFPPPTSAAATPTEDVDLAPFYAEHLAATKKQYADYNAQLWKMQAALLWPAVKAAGRKWRWKYEVWRAGGEQRL